MKENDITTPTAEFKNDQKVKKIAVRFPVTEKINKIAILGLLLLVSAGMLPILKLFFVPIILAATFATLFYPLYTFFLRLFRGNRVISSLSCCASLLLCFIVPTYVVMHLVFTQFMVFYQTAEPVLKDIMARGSQSQFIQSLQSLPFIKYIDISTINLTNFIREALKALLSFGTGAINKTSAGVFGFFVDIVIMFFTMFYFFIDGNALIKRIKYLSPIRDDYEDLIFSRFLLISRATVLGTILIGIIQGTLGALSLLIFGVKSWLLWGFVMIILSIMPVIGAWIVLVPAGIIQLITGNIWQGIGLLLMSTVVISNIDNLIRPRLVGKGAKLHDLIIFFSSLGGIAVFGIMGFIIGPVIAALFISVLDIYSTEFESQLKQLEKHPKNLTEQNQITKSEEEPQSLPES